MALTAREGGETAPTGPGRLLADTAAVARHADARLSAALHDLFMADFVRPTDSQRAAMSNMLYDVVEEIERDLRRGLIERLGEDAPAVLGVQRIPIVRPIFDRAGVLKDRDLVALLLTRAEEQRIAHAIRRVAQIDPEPAPQVALGVAAQVETALLTAEARRWGAQGAPALPARDLPAELLHKLLWWSAAALRDYLERTTSVDAAQRDDALAAAVAQRLAEHDEGQALDAAAMRVAIACDASDALLFDLFRAGRFSLFVAMLAVRARLDYAPTFLLASDPSIGALAVLLRAIEAPTQVAAPILLQMAAINRLSDAKLEERVNDFLDLDLASAQEAIRPWRLDRTFRHAIADIGRERRGR